MDGDASTSGTQDDDGAAGVVVVAAQVIEDEEDDCDDSTDTDTDDNESNNDELGGDAVGTKMQISPSTNNRKSHSMRIKLPLFKKKPASSIDNSDLSRDSATSMHGSLPVNRESKNSRLLGGDGQISRTGQRKLGSLSQNANICLVGAAIDEVKSKNSSVVGHFSHAVDSNSSISEKASKLNSCQSFPPYLSTFLNSNNFHTKNISECLSQIQPVRIPDIVASPGLMLPPAPLNTPTVVFRNVMKKALASRPRNESGQPNTVEPCHKGSSIQRCVDDMFDSLVVNMSKEVDVSNVLSAIHIDDALISENLRRKTIKRKKLDFCGSNQDAETSKDHVCDEASINVPLGCAVVDSINVALKKQKLQIETDENNCKEPRKLKTYALSFIDMVPTSLTTKYPFEYIQKYRTFLEMVEMRELAILDAQSAQDCFDSKMDSYEDSLCKWNDKMIVRNSSDTSPPIPNKSCSHPLQTHPIPPIPSPPLRFKETDTGQKSFLKHLDFDLFQAPCRYHNLMSNKMIDQHFVGPCAPGIVALTTGSNSANTLNLSPIAGKASSLKAESKSRSKSGTTSEEKSSNLRMKSSKKKSKNAIKSQELRAIFESNSEYVATMRDSLIRAAISCFTNGNGDGRTPWIGTSLSFVFVLMPCLCSQVLTLF